MHSFSCELCGQPATIHETAVENGAVVARHLCAEHGESAWRSATPRLPADAWQAVEEYARGLSPEEWDALALRHRLSRRRT